MEVESPSACFSYLVIHLVNLRLSYFTNNWLGVGVVAESRMSSFLGKWKPLFFHRKDKVGPIILPLYYLPKTLRKIICYNIIYVYMAICVSNILTVLLHFQHVYIAIGFHELHKCCNVGFNFLRENQLSLWTLMLYYFSIVSFLIEVA